MLVSFPAPCLLLSRVLSQMSGARWSSLHLPRCPCPVLTLFLVSQARHHSTPSLLHCHRCHRDHSPGNLPLGPLARGLGSLPSGSTSSLDTVARKLTSSASQVSPRLPALAHCPILPTPPPPPHPILCSRAFCGHAIPGHQGLSQPTLLRRQAPDCP